MPNLALVDTTPNDWNQGPGPKRAAAISRMRRRRSDIVAAAARLLRRKTLGNQERVLGRLEKLAVLHAEYHRLGAEIIAIELL